VIHSASDSLITSDDSSAVAEDFASDGAAPWVFWFLLGLAFAAFIPCIVLPEWRDYQAARVAEEAVARENARIRTELSRQRQVLEAVRSDPAVMERMARRELAYAKPGEVAAPRLSLEVEEPPERAELIEAPAPPAPIERILTWMPFAADDNIFCDPSTRLLIMALSGGLVVTAFVLFPPRRPQRTARACDSG